MIFLLSKTRRIVNIDQTTMKYYEVYYFRVSTNGLKNTYTLQRDKNYLR